MTDRRRLLTRTRAIGRNLRQGGLGYLLRAPGNELRYPRLAVTKRLRTSMIRIVELLHPAARTTERWSEDSLIFVLDLGVSPVSFDFVTYLAGAEIERRRRGLAGLFVVFIPGADQEVRRERPEYDSAITLPMRQSRVRNVLIPLLSLLPSVSGHVLCPSRAKAERLLSADPTRLFPEDFRVWLPRIPDKRTVHERAAAGEAMWPLLRATERGRQIVEEFLRRVSADREPIVITLRESATATGRNSRMEQWAAFAQTVDRSRFTPIFVYDTEGPIDARPPALAHEIFCEAARWNIEVRMALYEAAWLNLAIMHGPMELCWFNQHTRYLLFLEIGADATSSEHALSEGGLSIRRDLSFATDFQHIVWQADEAGVVRMAFDEMVGRIDAARLHQGQGRRA